MKKTRSKGGRKVHDSESDDDGSIGEDAVALITPNNSKSAGPRAS